MKKLLTLALLAFGMNASAQTSTATDTATNAQTKNYVVPTGYFKGSDGVFAASIVATKISGTTAGTAYLQGSVDGVNYVNLLSPNQTYADSFLLANVAGAQVKNWYRGNTKLVSLRVQVVTTGTQSTQLKAYFIKN